MTAVYGGVPRSKATAHLPTYSDDSNSCRVSSIATPATPATQSTFVPEDDLSISPPAPPPHLRKLSELIDPASLFGDDWAVKSPSGNMLCRQAFQERKDRPLSMRERQERIRQEMIRKNSYAVQGIQQPDVGSTPGAGLAPRIHTTTASSNDETLEEDAKRKSRFCCF